MRTITHLTYGEATFTIEPPITVPEDLPDEIATNLYYAFGQAMLQHYFKGRTMVEFKRQDQRSLTGDDAYIKLSPHHGAQYYGGLEEGEHNEYDTPLGARVESLNDQLEDTATITLTSADGPAGTVESACTLPTQTELEAIYPPQVNSL